MDKVVFAKIGAVFYVLWGLLHYTAAYGVYRIGLSMPLGIVQGRLYQEAFYLVAFATSGIVLAIAMNWQNSRTGFWLNALILAVGDIPFILFVLVPGYAPFWPGIWGPALWVAGMIFTGLGQTRRAAAAAMAGR
jgi:hypothetical protein